jgi:hypothetical protein
MVYMTNDPYINARNCYITQMRSNLLIQY